MRCKAVAQSFRPQVALRFFGRRKNGRVFISITMQAAEVPSGTSAANNNPRERKDCVLFEMSPDGDVSNSYDMQARITAKRGASKKNRERRFGQKRNDSANR